MEPMEVDVKRKADARQWKLSPKLSAEGRDAILIPAEATHYAFAYPLEDEDLLKQLECIFINACEMHETLGKPIHSRFPHISIIAFSSTL